MKKNYFENLKIADQYGQSKPIYYSLVYDWAATILVKNWDTKYHQQQGDIRRNLENIVQIIVSDGIQKMRINPNMNWVKVNPQCVRLLFNAGILRASSVYDQVSKVLYNNVDTCQLELALNSLTQPRAIADAFQVFADRWILHETSNGALYVANKHINEEILNIIANFVSENTKFVEGLFSYDFILRSYLLNETHTKGESVADARANIIRGADINHNGDTELSVFDLNVIYMASEASSQQALIDARGYHNPNIIGLLLARMFQPQIIIQSVNKVLNFNNLSQEEIMSYFQYRGNDILLENLQNSMMLWDEFHNTFDFSDKDPRQVFWEMTEFLHINSNLLTEEGLAVLKCLQTYIVPMLNAKGIYERTVKNGEERILSYDQFFQIQLNKFGQLMSEPKELPATMKAFLADGMYGAGKRRVITELRRCKELPSEYLKELDEAFDEAYKVYNQDGSLDELLKSERQRKEADNEFIAQSLDAIRDAGGDDAVWENFISDGVIDPTWEAILAIEGLTAID